MLATAVLGLGGCQSLMLSHGLDIRRPNESGTLLDEPSADFATGRRPRRDRATQLNPDWAASLRNEVVNDATMDIGESKIPTGVPVRQFLMIETE